MHCILSTAVLDARLIAGAAEHGVSVDAIAFIEVADIDTDELKDDISVLAALPVTAVFTSVNAVKSATKLLGAIEPAWNIYCLANATLAEVQRSFEKSVVCGTAPNGAALAELICEEAVQEVVFFCGNKRLDTVTEILSEEGLSVYEYIVYQTSDVPVIITKTYDCILFFSPSAVSSFFSVNKVDERTTIFAIGRTTADAVSDFCNNRLVVAEIPAKEQVLADAINFLKNTAAAENR